MTTAHQLKAITQRLSLPPFSKTINVIQLHDEYSVLDLLLLISQVSTVIDDRIHNPMAGLSVKLADPQDLANRLGDFLRVLKFPTDWYFLLTKVAPRKLNAYL